MPNNWTTFLRQKAKELNTTYGCALSMIEVLEEYTNKYPPSTENAIKTKIKYYEKKNNPKYNKVIDILKSKLEKPKPKEKPKKEEPKKEELKVESKPKKEEPKEEIKLSDYKNYYEDVDGKKLMVPFNKYYIGILNIDDLTDEPIKYFTFDNEEEQYKKIFELTEEGYILTFGDTFKYTTDEEYFKALTNHLKIISRLANLIIKSSVKAEEYLENEVEYRDELLKFLDLPKTATKTEINKKYRQMSLKLHPDKNPDKKANEKFKELVNLKEKYDKDELGYNKEEVINIINKAKIAINWYNSVFSENRKIHKKLEEQIKQKNKPKPKSKKKEITPEEVENKIKILNKLMEAELAKKNPDPKIIAELRKEFNKYGLANLRVDDDDEITYDKKDVLNMLKKLDKSKIIKFAKTNLNLNLKESQSKEQMILLIEINIEKINPSFKTFEKYINSLNF
jgi:hypothetical protein